MQKLARETWTALIWITHDLSVIAGLADRVCVMYAGRVVESGTCVDVLSRPAHPYTQGLLDSVPSRNPHVARLRQIPGMTPSLIDLPAACAFRERCGRAVPRCEAAPGVAHFATGGAPRTVRCHAPLVTPEGLA
jgi:peptide/nickel transport system ATP-binding protein